MMLEPVSGKPPRGIWILIPTYNEATTVGKIIARARDSGWEKLIVIDDASNDDTGLIARRHGALVVRHLLNRGKGAAIRTGFEIAKILNADTVVVMDGDGQHDPKDIAPLVRGMRDGGYDVAIGVRIRTRNTMPFYKAVANLCANWATYLLYGIRMNDSQSGLRAYSKKALRLISTKFDGYEHESEMVGQITKHKLRFTEVPVGTHYSKYSEGKPKRQTLGNGLKLLFRLILFGND